MKNIIEALLIVWPRGIPADEYERALSLASKFGALAPSLTVKAHAPSTNQPSVPAANPKPSAYRISKSIVEKVRDALSTGEATGKEISEATGVSLPNVMLALRQVGKHVATRRREVGFGRGPKVWALKEEAK